MVVFCRQSRFNRTIGEDVLKKKSWLIIAFPLLAVFLLLAGSGCSELHNAYLAPEAKDFHPKTIAILPAEVGVYGEARGVIDQVIAGVLTDKKWFSGVISADALNQGSSSREELQKAITEYLAKLRAVSFSDPDLSKKIGRLAGAESLLAVTVDHWTYTVDKDKKLARVGLGVKMIDAATGKIMWKASHVQTDEYSFFKPDLSGMASGLFKNMIAYMPH